MLIRKLSHLDGMVSVNAQLQCLSTKELWKQSPD